MLEITRVRESNPPGWGGMGVNAASVKRPIVSHGPVRPSRPASRQGPRDKPNRTPEARSKQAAKNAD